MAVGLVLTVLLAACSTVGTLSDADSGPLGVTQGSGEWCLPAFETDSDVVHGSEVLYNESDSVVQIKDVSLVDARNLEIRDSYQGPPRNTLVGTLLGWPSAERLQKQAFEPLGRIDPNSQANLVILLRSGDDPDSADLSGVRIEYEVDGKTFSVTTGYSVTWRKRC
ncbi:hypothetical protein [Nocardioides sp. AX2bis]|uniref:hypothetical protein n=1 Tax=Nocardioides sp. AX2bis TaxID=2653157 RepID=UPI00135CD786|nr:hypothetical protein [Nocardioides sp. AX2bis]